ncbi:MAG: sulfite exporter TauE/SafE family protein [Bacteroidota bacterium]|nr:sulfite exporter TauE/SafE family protein [Bacteroidota bacterium]
MEIIGYIASILIGISLGLVGSGGSVLTVPVLVYLMNINPLLATTSSLFIVGSTSLVGGLRAYSKKMVAFKAVIEFGIPSIFSIFITRHYILPALPSHLFTIGSIVISKDMFLMIAFAIFMIAASVSMIRHKHKEPPPGQTGKQPARILSFIALGLFVGVITGFLGAGGGFLIIPSLVLFLKLPMKISIGTSLFIIGINSLLGFLFSLNQFEYNWPTLLTVTALAIAGIFIGSRFADKIPGISLRKGFGWFILAMGIYIIIKEGFIK